MIKYVYNISPDSITPVDTYKTISNEDDSLIGKFTINTQFNPQKHNVQVHITENTGEVIDSFPEHSTYKVRNTKEIEGDIVASDILINPIEDIRLYGFDDGDVRLLYHFVNDLYTEKNTYVTHYIDAISPDRTELRLINLTLSSEDIVRYTEEVKVKLNTQAYFSEFKLDFGGNNIIVATNIDTLDYNNQKVIVVKLYEPLPFEYNNKTPLSILEIIADSVVYQIQTSTSQERKSNIEATLRAPNFNLDIIDENVVPTGFLNYNELLSYPINNTNSEIYSLFAEKSIEISVDYSDYANFIHFSSAEERLLNFKYKVQLIESHYSNLSQITNSTSQSIGTTNTLNEYKRLITGIVDNFDPYERYLYYNSGSAAWPKSNNTKPFINTNSTGSAAINWFSNQLTVATGYDYSNFNSLINTIPSFLREDPKNDNYLTFIYMIGQHFDGLWLYTKAVTDKYDNDNRLNYGIPKDLIGEVLKNFGVKLYTSNNSIENLFGSLIGQTYDSGSEDINTYVTASFTGSNTPIPPYSYDDYNKQVQKRIYSNLSYLIKTKGTERGLRALINCYGIPANLLTINLFGGRNNRNRPYYGNLQYATSSLDKIRLDHTGSITSGDTLSSYVSIIKRDDKYTDDLHAIEVGFSPTHNVDNYILSASSTSFNIDQYIGDPSDVTQDSYNGLQQYVKTILKDLNTYNVQDYVRLIKFFDNTIFKMVKDFIPGRVVADTGIIIKPHLLQRSKAKSVGVTGDEQEYIGIIDTAFISGRHGSTINDSFITSYVEEVQTKDGMELLERNNQEQPRYNGELLNSTITVTDGELNPLNIYKDPVVAAYPYGSISFLSQSYDVCLLNSRPQATSNPFIITSSTYQFTNNVGSTNLLFTGTKSNTIYTVSPPPPPKPGTALTLEDFTEITPPVTIQQLGYLNYSEFTLIANNADVTVPCTDDITIRFATCSISLTDYAQSLNIVFNEDQYGNPEVYNLTSTNNLPSLLQNWYNNPDSQTIEVKVQNNNNTPVVIIPDSTGAVHFPTELPSLQFNDTITVTFTDLLSHNCVLTKTVLYSNTILGSIPTGSRGLEVPFSYFVKNCNVAQYTGGGSPLSQQVEACFADAEVETALGTITIPPPPIIVEILPLLTFANQPGDAQLSNSSANDSISFLPQFIQVGTDTKSPSSGLVLQVPPGNTGDPYGYIDGLSTSQNVANGSAYLIPPPLTPQVNSINGTDDMLNQSSILDRGLQSYFTPYYTTTSPSPNRVYDVFAIFNSKDNYTIPAFNTQQKLNFTGLSTTSIYHQQQQQDTYVARELYRGVNLDTELSDLQSSDGDPFVNTDTNGIVSPYKIKDLYKILQYRYNYSKYTDTLPQLKPIPCFTPSANYIELSGAEVGRIKDYPNTFDYFLKIKKDMPVAYVIRSYEYTELGNDGLPKEPTFASGQIAQITVYPTYMQGAAYNAPTGIIQPAAYARRMLNRILYPSGEPFTGTNLDNNTTSGVLSGYSSANTKYGFENRTIPIDLDLGFGFGGISSGTGADQLFNVPIRKRYKI